MLSTSCLSSYHKIRCHDFSRSFGEFITFHDFYRPGKWDIKMSLFFQVSMTVGTLSLGWVGQQVSLTLEHCHTARDEELEWRARDLKKVLDVTASSHLVALLHLLSATSEVPRCAHLKVATCRDEVRT